MMLSAFGKKEKEPVIQVTGVVRLVGTELFQDIVITGPENEWYVDIDDMDKLHDLQHRTVTVEGVETVRELKSASGLFTIMRRELKKIKVISVE
jgi:hypothetical protein